MDSPRPPRRAAYQASLCATVNEPLISFHPCCLSFKTHRGALPAWRLTSPCVVQQIRHVSISIGQALPEDRDSLIKTGTAVQNSLAINVTRSLQVHRISVIAFHLLLSSTPFRCLSVDSCLRLIAMAGNDTFIPTYDTCDEVSDLCPVEATIYGAELSKGAAVFFGIAFLTCFIVQIYFGIRARTWSFLIWLGLGTIFECLGYLARFSLARNPWSLNSFIVQYLTLLLAPTLVAAAISVTFKSIVIWYGKQWSVLRPALYPWVFVGTDFLSIFIQIVGGGATAAATTGNAGEGVRKLGEALVIGGVAFQVANMMLCGGLMLTYTKRRMSAIKSGVHVLQGEGQREFGSVDMGKRGRKAMSRVSASEKEAKHTRLFVYALAVAYVAIIIRCSYR